MKVLLFLFLLMFSATTQTQALDLGFETQTEFSQDVQVLSVFEFVPNNIETSFIFERVLEYGQSEKTVNARYVQPNARPPNSIPYRFI